MTDPMRATPFPGPWLRHAAFLGVFILGSVSPFQAHALSAFKDLAAGMEEDGAAAEQTAPADGSPGLPLPDAPISSTPAGDANSDAPKPLNGGRPAEVIRDIATVPEAVRRTRQLIVEAAASGDIAQLRPLLGTGAKAAEISVGDSSGDPIETLKELAGDPDGIEILSSILNIMGSGFVHVSPGTPDEAYVWPYFVAKPLNTLTPPEKVELMRIVTAGDYQDMLDFGTYSFFRIGIAPDGTWKFFRSGE